MIDAFNIVIDEIAQPEAAVRIAGAKAKARKAAIDAVKPSITSPSSTHSGARKASGSAAANASKPKYAAPQSKPNRRKSADDRGHAHPVTRFSGAPVVTNSVPAKVGDAGHLDSETHGGTASVQASARADGDRGRSPIVTHIWSAPVVNNSNPARAGDAGHTVVVTHEVNASVQPPAKAADDRGRLHPVTHSSHATVVNSVPAQAGDDGQVTHVTHASTAIVKFFKGSPAPEIIKTVVTLWRMRQRWHRAEKSLTLQGKAICRSWMNGDKAAGSKLFDAVANGDKNADVEMFAALDPFISAIRMFEPQRAKVEKKLCELARMLPIHPWTNAIKGVGDLSLAGIVGEAGDVGSYRGPACLWKRFGLAVLDGKRQRKCKDKKEAEIHGFNPARRAVMWNIGGGIIGGMGRGPRPGVGEDISGRDDLTDYQKLFIERCRIEADKNDGELRREPVVNEKTGELRESYGVIASARAKRYVEKRFLRHLWVAWRADVA